MNESRDVLGWCKRGVVAVAMFTLFTGAGSLAVAPPTIDIKGFKFAPPAVTAPVGTTLT